MGAEMATQWKTAYPDKPIVMVELGWPNHTEVKSGRTDPWVAGVLSVDPKATDLGCLDVSKGTDQAKQVMTDLLTTHPEVNLIYSEASGQTVGTMAALTQAGRGKFDNGKPLTEIVSSVDFDEVEMKEVYDPNSSLKLSMGLPPVETARGRIDLIMDIQSRQGQTDFATRRRVLLQSLQHLLLDNASWRCCNMAERTVRDQRSSSRCCCTAKPAKIAFFVSDLSNVFHQAQAAEAQKYAKEKYGAEVFVFDGKADSAVMTQNVDQILAQGMDGATLHIWDYDAVKPAVLEGLIRGSS